MNSSQIYETVDIGYKKSARCLKNNKLEYYIIPYKKNYLIYFPLKGIISSVNKEFIKNIDNNDNLIMNFFKIIKNRSDAKILEPDDFINRITLELTSVCNLRCIYCYANGGNRPKTMNWKMAKAGIGWAINKCEEKTFSINFYGSGEPLLAFPMMKKSYEYAKEKCDKKSIKLTVQCTTNGTLITEDIAKWFKKVNMKLKISFDGIEELQNKQRPFRDGSQSYPVLKKSIILLNKYKINYATVVCITKDSLFKMSQIVNNLHSLNVKSVVFSRIEETGRCKETGTGSPDFVKFWREYEKASKLAKKYKMMINNNSPYKPGVKTKSGELCDYYCKACGHAFNVTARGFITSCFVVTDKNKSFSDAFFYGKIGGGKVKIDRKKLEYLRNRRVNNMLKCKDCYAKYFCRGGCLLEEGRNTGSVYKVSGTRCSVMKKRFRDSLTSIF